MSADLLAQRVRAEIDEARKDHLGRLIEGRNLTLDALRYEQGFLAGLQAYDDILEERRKNLFANG